MRYRLFDIDRIISRTLAYAIVTGLLVGVYAGIVLLATQVVSITTPVAVAASTLAAAALINPLRRRVQRVVNRRFRRRPAIGEEQDGQPEQHDRQRPARLREQRHPAQRQTSVDVQRNTCVTRLD